MSLNLDILKVFTFFRSLWDYFPVTVQALIFFVLFLFILLAVLKMTH